MNTKKIKNSILIQDISMDAVLAFIRFDFVSKILTVTDNDKVIESVEILEKSDNKDDIKIILNGKSKKLTFSKLCDILSDMFKKGSPLIAVSENDFNYYKSLISCCENINDDILNNSYKIGYNKSSRGIYYYNIIYPFKGNKPRSLYYFEGTNIMLLFDDKGFRSITNDAYNSIEDILTK